MQKITAKKRFGQNFLKDEAIKNQIIQAIPEDVRAAAQFRPNCAPALQIVEIGPGLGDLTEKLLAANLSLKSLEIDADLLGALQQKFAAQIAAKRWELVHQDALAWRSEGEYFIVANLPYNISAPLVINALCDSNCAGMQVMVQAEMAERILGTSAGALGLLAAAQCDSRAQICSVPPSAFVPAPKVNSAVILLRRSPDALAPAAAREFASFAQKMFAQPRKQLKAAVKHDARLLAYCDELGLLGHRPAQVSVSSFLEIFKRMKNDRKQDCKKL